MANFISNLKKMVFYIEVSLASFEHCIYPGLFQGEFLPHWFDSRQTRSTNTPTHVQKLPSSPPFPYFKSLLATSLLSKYLAP